MPSSITCGKSPLAKLKPMLKKKERGNLGEKLAVSFLKRNHYQILQRNFRSRFGEIDIVAKDGEDLVFIEVKTRAYLSFGTPEEAITPEKIKRIIKSADYFKLLHPELPDSLRIDLVAVDLVEDEPQIRIIKNITA